MQKTVSYLGPDGSWSEICSLVWFKGYARLPCRSFDEALDMVEVGKSDVCVIPVENSIEGPVTQVLDILSDSSLNIIGEKIMKIRHSLLSNSGEIKVVVSSGKLGLNKAFTLDMAKAEESRKKNLGTSSPDNTFRPW